MYSNERNSMKITRVDIFPAREDTGSKHLAGCAVHLDDVFKLSYISIIDGKEGLFISMPQLFIRGERSEAYHSIDSDYFHYFKDTILEAYRRYEDTGERVFRLYA